jgi:hypothetical protein
MKIGQISLILSILLLCSCSSAEHLEFNNIPIEGNLDKFTNDLIAAGFTESQSINENQISLNGKFLSKDYVVNLYGTGKSETVYKVIVALPGEVHDSLEYSFERIRNLFTTQYGVGISKYRQFRNSERFFQSFFKSIFDQGFPVLE